MYRLKITTPIPPLSPLNNCPAELAVSEACLLGRASSDVSLFVADVFSPLSKTCISKKLISEASSEELEESDVLLQSLTCVYASMFKPWSDIVGGTGLQSAYQQLSTSEQSMSTDGLSILTAAIHAHAGHFAIPTNLPIPTPMDDDFLRQTTDYVFSRGNDLLVAKSTMALDDATLFRDDLKVLAQGSHFGGLTEDLPGLFCIFDFSLAFDHVDPALSDRSSGETTDSLCKAYNLRFGAKSTSPDLTSLSKSVGCRSSIGLIISNQASSGQALTAMVPNSGDYRRFWRSTQPQLMAWLMATICRMVLCHPLVVSHGFQLFAWSLMISCILTPPSKPEGLVEVSSYQTSGFKHLLAGFGAQD